MSTVALRGLRAKHHVRRIEVLSWHPDLLDGLDYIDCVSYPGGPQLFERHIKDHGIIDLRANVAQLPHRRPEKRHIIDILCDIADFKYDGLGPDLYIPVSAENDAREFLLRNDVGQRKLVLVHPQNSSVNKDWNAEEWYTLAERLVSSDVACCQIGGDSPIHPRITSVPTQGKLQFALLRAATACVCVNSVFLHAAAALHVQTCISVLGSSHPDVVSYPFVTNVYSQAVDCQPCGRSFMEFDLHYDSHGNPVRDACGRALRWMCPDRRCFAMHSATDVLEHLKRIITL